MHLGSTRIHGAGCRTSCTTYSSMHDKTHGKARTFWVSSLYTLILCGTKDPPPKKREGTSASMNYASTHLWGPASSRRRQFQFSAQALQAPRGQCRILRKVLLREDLSDFWSRPTAATQVANPLENLAERDSSEQHLRTGAAVGQPAAHLIRGRGMDPYSILCLSPLKPSITYSAIPN